MAVESAMVPTADALDEEELRALAAAGAWYASYHGRIISEQADDRSAAAVARREEFRNLHAALRKLGVRLRLPDGL